MNRLRVQSAVIITIISMCLPGIALASTITLSPSQVTVHQGDSFTVRVNVSAGASPVYTVKMNASFTPVLLTLATWKFNDTWTVLRQAGYDLFDNAQGILIRTGGYPSGFTGNQSYGSATFVAREAGHATLSLTGDSFVYDDTSTNTYTGANTVSIDILPRATSSPAVVATSTPVDHSFDIALEIAQPRLPLGGSLMTLVHLTNLSKKVTALHVPVRYSIVSSTGAIVRVEDATTSLETVNTKFAYSPVVSDLAPGAYMLMAQVEYPDAAAPAQATAGFSIQAPVVVPPLPAKNNDSFLWPLLLLALIIGAVGGMSLMRMMRRGHHHPSASTVEMIEVVEEDNEDDSAPAHIAKKKRHIKVIEEK
jgi:hypothetical protein